MNTKQTERVNQIAGQLIGASIVGFGLTNSCGRDYPVIMLDNGAEIAIQSDPEGNDGGAALISDYQGNVVQLSAGTLNSPPDGHALLVGVNGIVTSVGGI